MLNKEQADYINVLRINHPGIDDDTLRSMLSGAGWPEHEILEALSRYKGIPVGAGSTLTPPPSTTAATAAMAAPTEARHTEGDLTSVYAGDAPQKPSHVKAAVLSVLVFLLIGGIGAGAYYAYENGYIGSGVKLTDDTIFKTTFSKMREMRSARYTIDVSIKTNPRDAGARSYGEINPPSEEKIAMYKRDQDRVRDVVEIQRTLRESRWSSDWEYTKPFPATLPATVNTNDPQGKPYQYTLSPDGSNYTLSVTFETQDAVTALQSRMYIFNESEKTQKVQGTTVSFTSEDYLSEGMFKGGPQRPEILSFLDLTETEYLPSDFALNIHARGTADDTQESVDAEFGFGGDLTFGDASFAIDAETIKKGDDYYGIINKIPSIFGSISKYKGTWFHVTKADFEDFGYDEYVDEFVPTDSAETEEEQAKLREQFELILEAADTHRIASIVGKPERVKTEAGPLTKYKLAMSGENFAAFYEDISEKLSTYKHPLIEKNDATLAYLKSEEAQQLYTYVKENITIELYFDRKGYPVKINLDTRIVPEKSAKNFENKQINIVLAIGFKDINTALTVTPPETSTPIDEILTDVLGMSRAELRIGRQTNNLSELQYALSNYHEWTGTYPTSLDELAKSYKDVPRNSVGSEYDVFTSTNNASALDATFLGGKSVPKDVFTKGSFVYRSQNGSYELEYTMELPSFRELSGYYTYATYAPVDYTTLPQRNYWEVGERTMVLQFAQGKNVATPEYTSQVQRDTVDSDKDGLANKLEEYLGTDSNKTDSDGDGVSDKDELTIGSDPLGTGRLKNSAQGFDALDY